MCITRHRMSAPISLLLALISVMWFLSSCATAPYTGRQQILLISESEETALGIKAYQDVLKKEKLSTDPKANALVKQVGSRIAAVSNKPGYAWEFAVIDSPKTVNAFALPGGKVAVYTGILPYTQTEAGLAFVLAHEVGHVIARHGGERMSQQLLLQLGQQGLNIAIASRSPAAVEAINAGYGIATTVGVALPFSRQQEYEADRIGLTLMAKAGYDPRDATGFFERMMKGSKQGTKLEFLSTHPTDENRIRNLQAMIPEALNHYRKR